MWLMASGVLFMVNRNYWVIRDGMRAGIHRVLRWHGHNASTVRSHDQLESKEVVARVVRVDQAETLALGIRSALLHSGDFRKADGGR